MNQEQYIHQFFSHMDKTFLEQYINTVKRKYSDDYFSRFCSSLSEWVDKRETNDEKYLYIKYIAMKTNSIELFGRSDEDIMGEENEGTYECRDFLEIASLLGVCDGYPFLSPKEFLEVIYPLHS